LSLAASTVLAGTVSCDSLLSLLAGLVGCAGGDAVSAAAGLAGWAELLSALAGLGGGCATCEVLLSVLVGFVGALFTGAGAVSGLGSGLVSVVGFVAASGFDSTGFGSLVDAGEVDTLSAADGASLGRGCA